MLLSFKGCFGAFHFTNIVSATRVLPLPDRTHSLRCALSIEVSASRAARSRASGFVPWHPTDPWTTRTNVRCWGWTGRHLLAVSLSGHDPLAGYSPNKKYYAA